MNTVALSPAAVAIAKVDPRESWPDWTDADTWELGPDPDEARPDWRGDHYEPTAEENARRVGFELGLADEPARPSRGMSIRVQDAWYNGWLAGNLARVEAERQELNDWYDSLERPDMDAMAPPEVVNQALGRCRVEVIDQP